VGTSLDRLIYEERRRRRSQAPAPSATESGVPAEPFDGPTALDDLIAETRAKPLIQTIFSDDLADYGQESEVSLRGPVEVGERMGERVAADATRAPTGRPKPRPELDAPTLAGETEVDRAMGPRRRQLAEGYLDEAARRENITDALGQIPLIGGGPEGGENLLRGIEGGIQTASLPFRAAGAAVGIDYGPTPAEKRMALSQQGLTRETPLPRALRMALTPLGLETTGDVAEFAGATGPLDPAFSAVGRTVAKPLAERLAGGMIRRNYPLGFTRAVEGAVETGTSVGSVVGGITTEEELAHGTPLGESLTRGAGAGVAAGATFSPLGAVRGFRRGFREHRIAEMMDALETREPVRAEPARKGLPGEAGPDVELAPERAPEREVEAVPEKSEKRGTEPLEAEIVDETAGGPLDVIIREVEPVPEVQGNPVENLRLARQELAEAQRGQAERKRSGGVLGDESRLIEHLERDVIPAQEKAVQASPEWKALTERLVTAPTDEELLAVQDEMREMLGHPPRQAPVEPAEAMAIEEEEAPELAEDAERSYGPGSVQHQEALEREGPRNLTDQIEDLRADLHETDDPAEIARIQGEMRALDKQQPPEKRFKFGKPEVDETAGGPLDAIIQETQAPTQPKEPIDVEAEEWTPEMEAEYQADRQRRVTGATRDLNEVKPVKAAWNGTFTTHEGTEAPYLTDGHLMVPKGAMQPLSKTVQKILDTAERGGGAPAAAMEKVWKQAVENPDLVPYREVGLYKSYTRAGDFKKPEAYQPFLLVAPDMPSVVVDARKLRLLKEMTGYDELRSDGGEDAKHPIVAYRGGKPVGVLAPLHGSIAEDLDEADFPPAPAPAKKGTAAISEETQRQFVEATKPAAPVKSDDRARFLREFADLLDRRGDIRAEFARELAAEIEETGGLYKLEGDDLMAAEDLLGEAMRTAHRNLTGGFQAPEATPAARDAIIKGMGSPLAKAGPGDRALLDRIRREALGSAEVITSRGVERDQDTQLAVAWDGKAKGYYVLVRSVDKQGQVQPSVYFADGKYGGVTIRTFQVEQEIRARRDLQWQRVDPRTGETFDVPMPDLGPEPAALPPPAAAAPVESEAFWREEPEPTPAGVEPPLDARGTPPQDEGTVAEVRQVLDELKATVADLKQEVKDVREGVGGRDAGEPTDTVSEPDTERPTGPGDGEVRETGDRSVRDGPEADGDDVSGTEGRDDASTGGAVGDVGGDGAGTSAGRPVTPGRTLRTDAVGLNYRLTDDDLIGGGGPAAKVARNLDALRTLKTLLREGRPATTDEQRTLARYVGWGAFPQIFDPKPKDEWVDLRRQFMELVTKEEYERAHHSIANAHFTSPEVIRGIYAVLERLGVTGGRFLEPSMGVGNFLGFTPENLPVQWSGVELDSLTGSIAKLLYPESDVRIQGFEESKFATGYFDVAVGNVPFGRIPVLDKRYPKFLTSSIHNYFFARTLDLVRPGGIVAYVTSRFTLDAQDPAIREWLAERAELVGAIRLPTGAFKKNAGTDVITDLIILQKKGPGVAAGQPWVSTGTVTAVNKKDGRTDEVVINEYYLAHPEMALGELELARSQFTDNDPVWVAPKGFDTLAEMLKAAKNLVPGRFSAITPETDPAKPPAPERGEGPPVPPGAKIGSLREIDGQLWQREPEGMVKAKVAGTNLKRVTQLAGIREAYADLLAAEYGDRPVKELDTKRAKLNKLYDAFVKAYGPINREKVTQTAKILKDGTHQISTKYPNLEGFHQDPDAALVRSLEVYDSDADKATKADVFKHRIGAPPKLIERVESPAEALPLVLDQAGGVDMDRIAVLSGSSRDAVEAALAGTVFLDPATGQWTTKDDYLSGNVKDKLKVARAAAKKNSRLQPNVEALEAVQPEDLPPSRIGVTLGAPWIPGEDYEAFLHEVLGGESAPSPGGRNRAKVTYNKIASSWDVEAPYHLKYTAAATDEFGTKRMDAVEIFKHAMNQKTPTVYDRERDGSVKNEGETLAAMDRKQRLQEKFAEWLWLDEERGVRLARKFNDEFNLYVEARPDGSHLTLQGSSQSLQLLPHQKDVIWRALRHGNTLLWHVVGAGKTYAMVGIAMESRRLGLARKPMIVVPNHMISEWQRQFLQMYPNAQVLVADKKDLDPDQRKRFLAKVASHNWDAIVVKYTQFERMKMSPEYQKEYINEQIRELEQAIREAKASKNKNIEKDLVKRLEKLRVKLKELLAQEKVDDLLTFEQLGVDMLLVDEAHEFKNLWFPTQMENVTASSSERAMDLYMKTRYLNATRPGRGVYLATGTPISNSISEAYTFQRYLQPQALERAGVAHFDAWARTFGETVSELEMKVTGDGFKAKSRFAKFKNLEPLTMLFRQVADVQMAHPDPDNGPDMKGFIRLPRPPLIGGKPEIVTVPRPEGMGRIIKGLADRAKALKGVRRPGKGEDNYLVILGDGRKASADMRLVDSTATGESSKAQMVADRVAALYTEYAAHRGTQLIFLDRGLHPKDGPGGASPWQGVPGFSIYDEVVRLLVERGVPKAEIAIAQHADTEIKKKALHAAVRAGKIRVLLGSTKVMGAGMNVQNRLIALHQLDTGQYAKPSDVEQREGRIWRRGNELFDSGIIPGVRILRYVTEGSFDTFDWGTVKRKGGFIVAFATASRGVDEIGDVDDGGLQEMAAAMAAASGDPRIMRQAELDEQVKKLTRLKSAHRDQQTSLRSEAVALPVRIEALKADIKEAQTDEAKRVDISGEKFLAKIDGKEYTKRPEAGTAIQKIGQGRVQDWKARSDNGDRAAIGSAGGFVVELGVTATMSEGPRVILALRGTGDTYSVYLDPAASPQSYVSNLEALLDRPAKRVERQTEELVKAEKRLKEITPRLNRPFPDEAKLTQLREEFTALNVELSKEKEQPAATDQPTEQELDDYEAEGGDDGTLYSVTDPVSAAVLALKQLRKLRRQRLKDREALAPSSLDEVEERWQKAKGITPETIRERAGRAIEELQASVRHFRYINPKEGELPALANEILLEIENAPRWAQAVAHDKIAEVVEGLTPGEVDTLTRVLALSDIEKDIDAGLYTTFDEDGNPTGFREMPFGYTDPAEVRADLEAAEAVVSGHTKLQAALAKRRTFAPALTRRLVELEQLPAAVLDEPRYYHRQVMSHLEAMAEQIMGGSPKEARVKKKGFQKGRVGGGDFNTRYIEAEFEWVSQAYQIIHMVESLERIKKIANIQGQLKAEAKSLNLAAFDKKIAPTLSIGDPHPLDVFRQRIGMATSRLYDMLLDRALPLDGRFDDLSDSLIDTYRAWEDAKQQGSKDPMVFDHPHWFKLLQHLMQKQGAGAREAATIFKAIRQREELIQTTLGRAYQTWESVLPEGYVKWQPVKGNYFYRALTVEERALEAALEGTEPLQQEKVRAALVMGGARETWVIPDWLAATLDNFGKPREQSGVGKAWVRVMGAWKGWTLLNPTRWAKYNLNNLFGDLDASILYPKITTYSPRASADLYKYMGMPFAKAADPRLKGEMQELIRLRVIDQGLTVTEIPDLNNLPAFQRLAEMDPSTFMRFIGGYWKWARRLTQYRENILRLSAYRYFLSEIQAGRQAGLFAASIRQRVEALKDPRERAALLARDLVGDYGNISEAGEFFRDRLFPFFSFQEINAKRYVNLFRNIAAEGKGERAGKLAGLAAVAGARAGVGIGMRALSVMLLANAFILLTELWNHLLFGEEEDQLTGPMYRGPHLILGRRADGSLRVLRIEGAFADFLEYLSLHDWPEDLAELGSGEKTPADQFVEAGKAPVDRVVGMWEPISKTLFETATRRSTFPSVFKPRLIRDRGEYAASAVSLGWLYRKVTDLPLRPSDGFFAALLTETDLGEAAYYRTREMVYEWQKKQGRDTGLPDPTARDNALYYWRKSLAWGQPERAMRWLAKYYELGGTPQNAKESIKRADPLSGVPLMRRGAFLKTLSEEEKQAYEQARDWYNATLLAPGRRSVGTTRFRPGERD
jgi:N12 class adenine-specific DNA methylase